jgi:hypothetical protein
MQCSIFALYDICILCKNTNNDGNKSKLMALDFYMFRPKLSRSPDESIHCKSHEGEVFFQMNWLSSSVLYCITTKLLSIIRAL